MNESEKNIAAKLLKQIEAAEANKQHDEIMKYVNFVSAVETRTRAEERSPK